MEMVGDFNRREGQSSPVILTRRFLEFLSMSSPYWSSGNILELYRAIFVILCQKNHREIKRFIENSYGFELTQECMTQKAEEWLEFEQIVRSI